MSNTTETSIQNSTTNKSISIVETAVHNPRDENRTTVESYLDDVEMRDRRRPEVDDSDHKLSPSLDATIKDLYALLFDNGLIASGKIPIVVMTFCFSTVLVVLALVLRDHKGLTSHISMTSGIFFGSIGTVIMCGIVIVIYFVYPACRKHSNILLLNRCFCDLVLAITFLMESVWIQLGVHVKDNESCAWISAIREYFIMTSVTWEFCMSLNLFALMNDPFTSPRNNRSKYQIIANTLGIIAAGTMLASKSFYGRSVGGFCWVKCSGLDSGKFIFLDAGIWIFIAVPVVLFISTNIYVTYASFNRFRNGIEATLDHRRTLLREGFLTTIAFIVYWLLLWGVYIAHWLTRGSEYTNELFGFLLSYRGSVVFILWFLYTTPSAPFLKNAKTNASAISTDGSGTTSANSVAEQDDAFRAQANYSLLKELVFYTTHGISKAVQEANKRQSFGLSETSIFTVHPPDSFTSCFSCKECQFLDYRPEIYARIRRFFNINDRDFVKSFGDCSIPKVSEGSSGSFMFFTSNGAYIVKSLTRRESVFLNSIVEQYAAYLFNNPNSFLTRILGSYAMVLYGRQSYFVVMENLFDTQQGNAVHHRYDIKGSWIDRNAEKARKGKEFTCKHCNMAYRCGGHDICPNRAGVHEPNVVLKDMDLTAKVRLGDSMGHTIVNQLKSDSSFLCDMGIMDYSLLLGVIEVRFQVHARSANPNEDHIHVPNIDTVASQSANVNDSMNTKKQSIACLRASDVVVGPGFYYIGIIDILQTWTWKKKLERYLKWILLRKDPAGISAIPPKPYCDRFQKKLEEIFHIDQNKPLSPRNAVDNRAPINSKVFPIVSKDDSLVWNNATNSTSTTTSKMATSNSNKAIPKTFSFKNNIWNETSSSMSQPHSHRKQELNLDTINSSSKKVISEHDEHDNSTTQDSSS